MRRTRIKQGSRSALLCALLACVYNVGAHEVTVSVDMRAVAIDSSLESFTHGGLGLLRFDESEEGLQLGRVLLDASGPLAETVRYTASAMATDDEDDNALDITEMYLDWRPYPKSPWRWRTRVGAFYAPISLENRAAGWESIYSLSPSAINTWVGEEMRTIGMEVQTTRLGAFANRSFDVTLVGAIYGWNDPMGVLLFERGWALHDRQSPLFGSLPRPFIMDPNNRSMEFFHESDGRAGYYAGAQIEWSNDALIRALHYDNRGDPDASSSLEPAWATRFEAVGVRIPLVRELTMLAQAMWGDTEVGPQGNGEGMFLTEYWSYYGLVSWRASRSRYTLRYDRMYVDTLRGAHIFDSAQDADAWTLACFFEVNEHWQVAAEALRVSGSLAQRATRGLPVDATEQQLQIAVRFTF